MSALLKKNDVFLKGLYLKYSHCGDDLKDADRTMYIRDFVKLLQSAMLSIAPIVMDRKAKKRMRPLKTQRILLRKKT